MGSRRSDKCGIGGDAKHVGGPRKRYVRRGLWYLAGTTERGDAYPFPKPLVGGRWASSSTKRPAMRDNGLAEPNGAKPIRVQPRSPGLGRSGHSRRRIDENEEYDPPTKRTPLDEKLTDETPAQYHCDPNPWKFTSSCGQVPTQQRFCQHAYRVRAQGRSSAGQPERPETLLVQTRQGEGAWHAPATAVPNFFTWLSVVGEQ